VILVEETLCDTSAMTWRFETRRFETRRFETRRVETRRVEDIGGADPTADSLTGLADGLLSPWFAPA
jgi:hypothetical protein